MQDLGVPSHAGNGHLGFGDINHINRSSLSKDEESGLSRFDPNVPSSRSMKTIEELEANKSGIVIPMEMIDEGVIGGVRVNPQKSSSEDEKRGMHTSGVSGIGRGSSLSAMSGTRDALVNVDIVEDSEGSEDEENAVLVEKE